MSMPPKDPTQRRRRGTTPGFESLDPTGRVAPAPQWPFSEPTPAEHDKWEDLWRLPQAIKWEQMHAEDLVALYVRALITSSDNMDSKLLNEVRQLDNKLGISPLAMRNLRWEIGEHQLTESAPVKNGKADRIYVPN